MIPRRKHTIAAIAVSTGPSIDHHTGCNCSNMYTLTTLKSIALSSDQVDGFMGITLLVASGG